MIFSSSEGLQMKDALGHGSNPRGGHAAGINQVGTIRLHPKAVKAMLGKADVSVKPTTGERPSTGFMVSRQGGPAVPQGTLTRAAIQSFANSRALAINGGAFMGKWTDNGKDYLDVSDNRKTSEAEATKLGAARNQIGIWDVSGKRFIPTGGTGK